MSPQDEIGELVGEELSQAMDEAKKKIKPKKSLLNKLLTVLLCLVLAAGIATAGYFGARWYRRMRVVTDDAALFEWEGDYVDTEGYMTSLSIDAQARKGFYDCTICMGEENSSDLIFWSFTAVYDKETNTLEYGDARRTDWAMAGDEIIKEDVYTQGSGHLETAGGSVLWTDNEEGFGKNMVFERSEYQRTLGEEPSTVPRM